MISTFSTMIRCSPVRAEMKALGLGSNHAPLLGLGFTFLAVVDVLAASIALAGS